MIGIVLLYCFLSAVWFAGYFRSHDPLAIAMSLVWVSLAIGTLLLDISRHNGGPRRPA